MTINNHLKPGMRVPEVTFKTRLNGSWVPITTTQILSQKTILVFALPGAYTPTCSSKHLPGYVSLSNQIKAEGIDKIYRLSVNDSFVMNAWAKEQRLEGEVEMLPDGNGEFTEGIGMLVDK